MRYTEHISTEPLDVIRCNECEYQVGSLGTARFRTLWNEIEHLVDVLKLVDRVYSTKAESPLRPEIRWERIRMIGTVRDTLREAERWL